MEHDWFDDLKAIRDCQADADIKHLLLVLQTYVRQDSCWPSIATIAKCLGVSERQAQYRMTKAKESGWIVVKAQFKDGRQTSNRIYLNYSMAYVRDVEGCNRLHPEGAMGCTQNYQEELEKKNTDKLFETDDPLKSLNAKSDRKVLSWSSEAGFHGDSLKTLKDSWKSAYPKVDVDAELRAMNAWLMANKPRYKDYGRFVNGWLRRTSERKQEVSNAHGRTNVRGQQWDTDNGIAPSIVKF